MKAYVEVVKGDGWADGVPVCIEDDEGGTGRY